MTPSGMNGRLRHIWKSLSGVVRKGMNVLDVGCGVGVLSKKMAEHKAIVTGIDISPKLIERAKETSSHENITYIQGDVCSFEFKGKYDLIVLSDVLEHISPRHLNSFISLNSLIGRLCKCAHDGSIIYLSIPYGPFITFLKKFHPEKLQIIDEPYSIEFITELFSFNSFAPVKMLMYGLDVNSQYVEYFL